MGCASSSEEKEASSYGPVAGRQKQFIESVNPNYMAPAMDDSPKTAVVCLLGLLCQYIAVLSRRGTVAKLVCLLPACPGLRCEASPAGGLQLSGESVRTAWLYQRRAANTEGAAAELWV